MSHVIGKTKDELLAMAEGQDEVKKGKFSNDYISVVALI